MKTWKYLLLLVPTLFFGCVVKTSPDCTVVIEEAKEQRLVDSLTISHLEEECFLLLDYLRHERQEIARTANEELHSSLLGAGSASMGLILSLDSSNQATQLKLRDLNMKFKEKIDGFEQRDR